MDFKEMSNDEICNQLYNEVVYYDEELYKLCKIICKQISKRMVKRITNKLYRIRNTNS